MQPQLAKGYDVGQCPSCSLLIRIVFDQVRAGAIAAGHRQRLTLVYARRWISSSMQSQRSSKASQRRLASSSLLQLETHIWPYTRGIHLGPDARTHVRSLHLSRSVHLLAKLCSLLWNGPFNPAQTAFPNSCSMPRQRNELLAGARISLLWIRSNNGPLPSAIAVLCPGK